MDNQVMMRIVHRIFYVSVGKAKPDTAQTMIDNIKSSVNQSDAEKGVPPNTFLDIYIPQWGDDKSSYVVFQEIEIPHTQFGKLPTNILDEINKEMNR